MKLKKSVKDARRTWRRTVIVMGLVLVLLLALAGASFAAPSAPMGKSIIGNYVWHDFNADGDHTGVGNEGETEFTAGIPNVQLELWIWNGTTYVPDYWDHDDNPLTPMIANVVTSDATGYYQFWATAEGTKYQVRISESNYDPDGPLDGYVWTSAGTYSPNVQMPNVIIYSHTTADFGFARTSITVAKDPPTQTLLPNSTATFTVIVTNSGEVAVKDPVITDDYAVCDPNPITGTIYPAGWVDEWGVPLPNWASTTCTTANVQNPFFNEVSASATPVDENGNLAPGSTPTADSNTVYVVMAAPSINVEKYVSINGGTNWIDADDATGPYLNDATVAPMFQFVVTNDGTVALHTITLTDSDFDLSGCTIPATLGVGESFSCTITEDWAEDQHTNKATTTGKYTDSSNVTVTVQDADDANYFGSNPEITVKKYVSIDCLTSTDAAKVWQDADAVTGPYLNGATCAPQFKIVVTNVGNVPLSNVDVTDSVYGAISLNGTLAKDASATYYVTDATWAAGQHTNVATASGDYVDGNGRTETDTDQNAANYFGSNPEITVKKYVSIDCLTSTDAAKVWQDADAVTGPYLNGATCAPQFKIVVTNVGNVPLSNVDVTDSVYGAISLNGTLAKDASATYYVTDATWAAGQHTNIATASGDFTDGNGRTETDTDQNAANYFGSNPEITIKKYVSVDGGLTWADADEVTGPILPTGVQPQFKLIVTNTGNVPINVSVTDTDATLPAGCVVATLDVGASDECIYTDDWAGGQQTNTATAHGSFTDGNNNTETDTEADDANYFGGTPSMNLVKTAGTAPDGTVLTVAPPVPVAVVYHYSLDNTGDLPLYVDKTGTHATYKLTDNKCSPVTYVGGDGVNDGLLDTTETWEFQCNASLSVDTINTGSVTANPVDENGNDIPNVNDLTDSDQASVIIRGSIGDFVWWDVDGDGIQDGGEPGIPGVDVTLFGYPTDTTEAGIYTFENLPAGSYIPTIPAAEFQPGGTLYGFAPTTPFQGGLDSNGVPDGAGGVQASVNLPAYTSNMTIDFGFVKPTSYTLSKTAVTVGPVTPDDTVEFRIRIVNTGSTYITVLPLVDTFDPTYLQFVSASVAPTSVVGGTITWLDVTGAGNLAPMDPDSFIDVTIQFKALADTTALTATNGETINTALVKQDDTRVDPDGPGVGIPEAVSPVPNQTSEDGMQIIQPTGVTLVGATVTATADGVLIAWQTADESAILGFNVLADGVAVNAELILASAAGTNAGAAYSYLDAAASGASGYALEVIGLDGSVLLVELGN